MIEGNIRKAIDNAIELERATYKMFMKLFSKADRKNLQDLFSELAKQELKHEALLKSFLETNDFEESKQRIEDEFAGFLEIAERIDPTEDVKDVLEGFELAIKQEKNMQELYKKLYVNAEQGELRSLFNFLYEEETKHEKLLMKEHDALFGRN